MPKYFCKHILVIKSVFYIILIMALCQTAVRIPLAIQTSAGANLHCTVNDLAKGRREEESKIILGLCLKCFINNDSNECIGVSVSNIVWDCPRPGKTDVFDRKVNIFAFACCKSELLLWLFSLHLLLLSLLFSLISPSLQGRKVSEFLRNVDFSLPWSPGARW